MVSAHSISSFPNAKVLSPCFYFLIHQADGLGCLHLFPVLWLWANYLTSLCLGFLMCWVGMIREFIFPRRVFFFSFFLFQCQKACVHATERERNREREQALPSGAWSHCSPFPPFCLPSRVLSMRASASCVFSQPPELRFKLQWVTWRQAPSTQGLTTVLGGQPLRVLVRIKWIYIVFRMVPGLY